MTWTPLIVAILVVIWILLERSIDKSTPKIMDKITRTLSITLSVLLLVATAIMLTQNAILTEEGKRIFNIVAPVGLIICASLLIICSIVELYNGKKIRAANLKLKGGPQ